ncbi:MAG: hypothetical protein V4496_02835 [Pseudomonadota bacterium]
MTDELKPPLLLNPIPKQQVVVGTPFRLDLNEYIQNNFPEKEDDTSGDTSVGLLYTVETEVGLLPFDLDYTITGMIYGTCRPPALAQSPYKVVVTVTNGSFEPLVTYFELIVLEALRPEDEWAPDTTLEDEFEQSIQLDAAEEAELLKTLQEDASGFSEEKRAIWEAIIQGQSIPELKELMDRPISHQEIYYLLSRISYFVIWDANNSAPAGVLQALALKGASEMFNVYDRGSCIVATPKQLFDHNRTLKHGVETAQAMANEVFQRGWRVEFGGFDKMVRAAWVEFELLSQKFGKPVSYSYFNPSSQDVDSLKQAQSLRMK